MFGGHSVHVSSYADVTWALRHTEVFSSKDVVDLGNDQPLIPLSVDPPEHRKYRRMLDPEFSPTKMAISNPKQRAARERDHRPVRRHGRVRVPRRLRDAAAVDDLPRAHRAPPERPAGLPAVAGRHDPARGNTPEEVEAKRQAAGQAINEYFVKALEEKRKNPDDRLLTRIETGEVDGARSPRPRSSGSATCSSSAGSTP